jgi:hypothetical protein
MASYTPKRLTLDDLVHELGLGPFPSYSPSAADAVDDGDGPYPPAWLNPKGTFTYYVPGDVTKTLLCVHDRTAVSEELPRRQGFRDVTRARSM